MLELSASFIRPNDATPYTSGDLVANSTTAGSVLAMIFEANKDLLQVRRVRIRKSGTGVTGAQFRLHLYDASPLPPTNGDNGVWLTPVASYLGFVDVTIDKAFSDGAAGQGAPTVGAEINVNTAADLKVYGLLEARGAYTPANNEVFTVTLETQVLPAR